MLEVLDVLLRDNSKVPPYGTFSLDGLGQTVAECASSAIQRIAAVTTKTVTAMVNLARIASDAELNMKQFRTTLSCK